MSSIQLAFFVVWYAECSFLPLLHVQQTRRPYLNEVIPLFYLYIHFITIYYCQHNYNRI